MQTDSRVCAETLSISGLHPEPIPAASLVSEVQRGTGHMARKDFLVLCYPGPTLKTTLRDAFSPSSAQQEPHGW